VDLDQQEYRPQIGHLVEITRGIYTTIGIIIYRKQVGFSEDNFQLLLANLKVINFTQTTTAPHYKFSFIEDRYLMLRQLLNKEAVDLMDVPF